MTAPLKYSIRPADPTAHLFEVRLTIADPDPAGQVLRLPAWIPGSYMIRDYARHVVGIRAESDGLNVVIEKLDKSRWQAAPVERELTITAEIYAFDESVRGAHLDTTHGFFNGTCVFLEPLGDDDRGFEDRACELEILPPDKPYGKHWRVATSMESDGAPVYGFGRYCAANYAELIDHPVEMGQLTIGEFTVNGVPHVFAIRGRHSADMARLCHDVEKLCTTQHEFLGTPKDLDRYVFLLHAPGEGYGGLEHGWSSSLVASRGSLPPRGLEGMTEEYRTFLGLVSHEYFHLWNVKRMKPARFRPYDLTQETHTGLLWVFEGITSYYDDLMLLRSGLIPVESWLEMVGQTMTRVHRNAGRLRQSVEASSFDAWTKFYKQDENAGNAIVSYYAKGSLIALALDLKLREDTDGRVSLDDVMHECWRRFGETGQGMGEGEFEAVCDEVSGLVLDDFFANAVRGTGKLPLDALFERHGIHVRYRAAVGGTDKGGKLSEAAMPVAFGAKVAERDGATFVTAVANGSPAEKAGLAARDQLLALDGLRVSAATLDATLRRFRPNDTTSLVVFRGDELMELSLRFTKPPEDTVYLELADDPGEEACARRNAWLLS